MRTDIDHPATGIRASLRWGRLLLLGLILLPLFFLKFQLNRGLGVETDDGNYYYQIARHVAAGDGLRTSVSLYHQGLRVLPQRATVYPLWPWLCATSREYVPTSFCKLMPAWRGSLAANPACSR